MGSVVVAHGLSCLAACGILVPWPGIEPVSPALEGGILTTGPTGKSPSFYIWLVFISLESSPNSLPVGWCLLNILIHIRGFHFCLWAASPVTIDSPPAVWTRNSPCLLHGSFLEIFTHYSPWKLVLLLSSIQLFTSWVSYLPLFFSFLLFVENII